MKLYWSANNKFIAMKIHRNENEFVFVKFDAKLFNSNYISLQLNILNNIAPSFEFPKIWQLLIKAFWPGVISSSISKHLISEE